METKVAEPGTVLGGKYRLVGLLGRGGMGAVYEAINTAIGKRVALKILDGRLLGDPALVRRFELEAQAAALINHPGIVDVLDVGRAPDDAPFMVMEYLHGTTLRELARAVGPMSPAQAVALMAPALLALEAAHAAGVIHRDLKPGNIFLALSPAPAVKLLDFGISKFTARGEAMTETGVVLGTVAFMAPEQLRSGRNVGPQSDLYSMGAVLYALLAGRGPHQADHDAELVIQIVTADATPLGSVRPDLPQGLCALVDRLLAREPQARPQSAREVRERLLELAEPDLASLLLTAARLAPPPRSESGPGSPPPPALAAGPLDSVVTPSAFAPTTPRSGPSPALTDTVLPKAATPQARPSPVHGPPLPGPAARSRRTWVWPLAAVALAGGVLVAKPTVERRLKRAEFRQDQRRARSERLRLGLDGELSPGWVAGEERADGGSPLAAADRALDRARQLDGRGRTREALASLDEIVERTSKGADPSPKAHALRVRGDLALDLDRCSEAQDYYQRAFAVFEAAQDHHGAGMAAQDLALLANLCVGPKRIPWYKKALEHRVKAGDTAGLFKSANALGLSYLIEARHLEAVGAFEQAAEAAVKLGDDTQLLKAQVNLVTAWARFGKEQEGVAPRDRWADAGVPASLGWGNAQAALGRALETARRLGVPPKRLCERVPENERRHCKPLLQDAH